MVVCEITVIERPDGYHVEIVVDGKLVATKGPFDSDTAYMVAKELAARAADTDKLIGRATIIPGGET